MVYEVLDYPDGVQVQSYIVSIFHRKAHFHSGMEILYILKNSVIMEKNQQPTLLQAGDIYIVEPNVVHSLRQGDGDNAIFCIQFDPGFCSAFFPQLPQIRLTNGHVTPACGRIYGELKQSLVEFLTCYRNRTEGYPFYVMSILNRLCYLIVDGMEHVVLSKDEYESCERNILRIMRIADYIDGRYMYRITLQEIAGRENLNMCYLSHFIKQQLGMSFQQYVNHLKTQKAASLLINSNKKMIDICIESGFSDQRYFNKAFEREYGISPAEYRKRPKKNVTRLLLDDEAQHMIVSLDEQLEQTLSQLLVAQ